MNLVRRSLLLCIGVLLGLLALQAAQSLWHVHALAGVAERVAASSRLADEVRDLDQDLRRAQRAWQAVTAFVDADSLQARRRDWQVAEAAVGERLKALQAGTDPALQADVQALATAVQQWLALSRAHAGTEAATELPSFHRLSAQQQAVATALQGLGTRSQAAAAKALAEAQGTEGKARLTTLLALVAAVALGSWLGWRALNGLHRQLGADASEVARLANAVAGGDLGVRIAQAGAPADSVIASMARMQTALRDTVGQVRQIGNGLTGGATEIAAGNADLSQRTEQQAAALERTASTMTGLGDTVRHNADSAAEAARQAEAASEVAGRGGAVVSRAVETMRGINDSSKKISEIIGVIDGIAFQTNILALNAAVEAARAGEQGRGFAVVAGEVRSLAQRTAHAAREVKSLITASVERVDSGSALVDEAGRTMQEVVQAIARVSATMAEIRSASASQSASVDEVGRVVRDLDQATQQNAALAEQSAAAAESLQRKGAELQAAVDFFRLQTAA